MKKIVTIALIMVMAFTVMPSQASAASKYIPKEGKHAYRSIEYMSRGVQKIGKYYYNYTNGLSRSTSYKKLGRFISKSTGEYVTNGKTVIYSKHSSSFTYITIYSKGTKKKSKVRKLVKLKGAKLVGYYKGKIYYLTKDYSGDLKSFNLRTRKKATIEKNVGYASSSFGPRIAFIDAYDDTLSIYNIKTGKTFYSPVETESICVTGKRVYYSVGKTLKSRNFKLKNAKKIHRFKGSVGGIIPGTIGAVVLKNSYCYQYSYKSKKLRRISYAIAGY